MESGLLYDGVSVKVFQAEASDEVLVRYTDGISAFNGIKKAKIAGKGVINASIASMTASFLAGEGVLSRYVRKVSDDTILCRKLDRIRMEVIVRNVIAGSMSQRLGLEEGLRPANTIFDLCYKDEELGDPLINDHYAVALGLASYDELKEIYAIASRVNGLLSELFRRAGMELVDFKIEFGRDADGRMVLADELTPDNARLWDLSTGEKLDRDRFRRDMGKVGDAYRIVKERLASILTASE